MKSAIKPKTTCQKGYRALNFIFECEDRHGIMNSILIASLFVLPKALLVKRFSRLHINNIGLH